LLPEDQQLLTDQQLRDASYEQLQDLIARVDLLLRSKGQPGLTLHPQKTRSLRIPPTLALSSSRNAKKGSEATAPEQEPQAPGPEEPRHDFGGGFAQLRKAVRPSPG